MNIGNDFLQMLYFHFGLSPEELASQPSFTRIKGGNASDFLLNRKRTDTYEQYVLSGSLLFSLIRYAPQQTTSAFLDLRSQFFSRLPSDLHNTGQLHKHEYFELSYVLDGQLDLIIEGSRHRLMPGDACIINSNARHRELYTSEYTVIYLGITPEYFSQWTTGTNEDPAAHILYDFLLRNKKGSNQVEYLNFTPLEPFADNPDLGRFHNLLEILLKELLLQDIGYEELCQVYLRRIFALLQNPAVYLCSDVHFQILEGDTLFERTLRYINESKRKVPRRELESALRYNGNYINRVFQKHTGQTLAEYNRDICLAEAARLLLNTDLNIRQVCQQVGYENKTVFYDLFKKKYGVTPQQYRERPVEKPAV